MRPSIMVVVFTVSLTGCDASEGAYTLYRSSPLEGSGSRSLRAARRRHATSISA